MNSKYFLKTIAAVLLVFQIGCAGAERREMNESLVDQYRYMMQIQFLSYVDEFGRLTGCKTNISKGNQPIEISDEFSRVAKESQLPSKVISSLVDMGSSSAKKAGSFLANATQGEKCAYLAGQFDEHYGWVEGLKNLNRPAQKQ